MSTALGPTLRALELSWERASEGRSTTARCIEVVGRRLLVESAGQSVLDVLWPALSHHRLTEGPPDLTLRLWALSDAGGSRPPLPSTMFQGDGELHDTSVGDEGYARFEPASQMLTAYVPATREAWCCVADPAGIAWWDRAAPLRSLFGWWLGSLGIHLIHGAAVGDDRGAVVLAGPGGAGKSTTAVSAVLAGMGFLGDDYCAVSSVDIPEVHSLYSTAKLVLDSQHLTRLGHLVIHRGASAGSKAVVSLAGAPQLRIVSTAPVRSVVATEVGEGTTSRFMPAHRARVLATLAPSSILQLPGTPAGALGGLAELVRRTPTVGTLRLGTATEQLVGLLEDLARGALAA